MSITERDQDAVALGRLLTYAQQEAKRLGLAKTEGALRTALTALLSDAPHIRPAVNILHEAATSLRFDRT